MIVLFVFRIISKRSVNKSTGLKTYLLPGITLPKFTPNVRGLKSAHAVMHDLGSTPYAYYIKHAVNLTFGYDILKHLLLLYIKPLAEMLQSSGIPEET